MKVLVAYSGGKDSQAALIWSVKQYGLKNVEAVFCDTGWENDVTYKHIIETTQAMGVKLVTLKSSKYNGMVDLALKKQRFPSTRARFCTEELKTKPFIDYVLDHKEHLLIIQGIRANESASRSLMNAQCEYFKYYFQPYKSNELTIERTKALRAAGRKLTHHQKKTYDKAVQDLAAGKQGKKYHTYRKKEVKEFVKLYSQDILRPVFDWTGQQVIDYIILNGQKPNPLYYKGAKRVGCYPCIMSGHNEVLEIVTRDPKRMDYIADMEKEVESSFFGVDYIPRWARSGVCKNTGKRYPKATDVKKYLRDKNASGDIFDPDPVLSCSSYYHLCE